MQSPFENVSRRKVALNRAFFRYRYTAHLYGHVKRQTR